MTDGCTCSCETCRADNCDDCKWRGTRVLLMWSERTQCVMCKHRFDKPHLLPVKESDRGKFQPNFNPEIIFHLSDTHGIPNDISRSWIAGSVYGADLEGVFHEW